MDHPDEVGAVAAAAYFLSLYEYAMASGDLTEWDSVSAQSCGFCANVREDLRAVYGAGGRYVGGNVDASVPEVVGFDGKIGAYAVELAYSSESTEEYDAAGAVVDLIPAESGFLLLDVIFTERGWTLVTGGVREESLL